MVSEEETPMKDFELLIGEEIIKETGGDCWETPGSLKKQVPGSTYLPIGVSFLSGMV